MRFTATALILAVLVQSTALAQQQPAPVDQFHKVKLMVNTGGKSEPTNVIMRLENDRLILRAGASDLKSFPYPSIKTAEYSYSKSPRWKSGAVAAVAVGIFALPLFFMKGKKHWLTIVSGNEFALIQLDKDNYKMILPAFEARSGVKVETVTEEK